MDVSGESKLDWHTTSLVGVHLRPGVQGVPKMAAARLRESQLRATIEAVPDGDRIAPTYFHVQLPGALIARVASSIGRRASDLALPLLINDEVV